VNNTPRRWELIVAYLLIVASTVVAVYLVDHESEVRTAQNAKTTQALCDAAAGARDFWVKVRASTRVALSDPTLSPTARRSNEQFEEALTDVIKAADGLAHSCVRPGSVPSGA
jgi:regulator of extracellular matrix RemA (YlzA/DUF370 family)